MIYMGSKHRIANTILPIILKGREQDQYFVDLFCGGCNMVDKVHGNRIANDVNKYVINLWKALQKGWTPPISVSEKLYNDVKNNPFCFDDEFVAFTAICCSFGAKWFGGYARQTKQYNYALGASNSLLRQIKFLREVKFLSLSYNRVAVPANSIIYCDPPYKGTSQYFDKGFNHFEFYAFCREKVEEGHKVFISEYAMPSDFVSVWSSSQSANLQATKKFEAKEKLFVHISQLPYYLR